MKPRTIAQLRDLMVSDDGFNFYKPDRPAGLEFTLMQPHQCVHCEDITVDGKSLAQNSVFLGDGKYSSTGQFKIPLSHSFDDAINASRAGCALYEWLLDQFEKSTRSAALPIHTFLAENVEFFLVFVAGPTGCYPLIEAVGLGERREIVDIGSSMLFVCAREGDASARIVTARPAQEDIFSSQSIEFSRESLETCLMYHEMCRSVWIRNDLMNSKYELAYADGAQLPPEVIPTSELPTRLLLIEPGDDINIRLVELSSVDKIHKSRIASFGFAALSYCWGPEGNPIQLTAASYKELQRGIPVAILPATVSDAVRFAYSMQLRYIWVDALCIFQDRTSDMEVEIARMGSYYGSNTLTLCAASASGCSQGLSGTSLRSVYSHGPIQLACDVGGVTGHLILHPEVNIKEPITMRGWTLQESLISRRLLIFSNQVYWCCVTANAECEGSHNPLPTTRNRNMGFPESLVPGIFPGQVMRDWPPEIQWNRAVADFTKRSLGVEGDKLLAISAFAAGVHVAFQSRRMAAHRMETQEQQDTNTRVSYVAGLFLQYGEDPFVTSQLFWTTRRAAQSRRVKTYRAPTWSWACIEGEIEPMALPLKSLFKLSGFQAQLTNDAAPYGSVASAELHIEAYIGPIHQTREFLLSVMDETKKGKEFGITAIPDTLEDYKYLENITTNESNVSMLRLTDILESGYLEIRGLLICQFPGASAETFRRIGTFSLLQKNENGEAVKTRMNAAFGEKMQNVILV